MSMIAGPPEKAYIGGIQVRSGTAAIYNRVKAAGIGVDSADSYALKYNQNGTVVTLADSGSETFTKSTTMTTAAVSGLTNQFKSLVQLTPATAVTATSGLNAIRGEVGLTSGKTLNGTSFLTGVYGRGNIFGTVDIGSGDLAAVYGKFDLNGSTLTSGHIAPVQANIVNPGATAAATVDLFYGESASGTKIKSGLSLYMAADYLMDVTDVGAVWFVGTAGSSASKYLRIKANGTAYKIALLADS